MKFLEGLLYSESHEWLKNVGSQATIGLTDYAQSQLKDIVYVQCTTQSRLAAIFAGETGLDPYTRAISDVYQDLYGEGSFTGKEGVR